MSSPTNADESRPVVEKLLTKRVAKSARTLREHQKQEEEKRPNTSSEGRSPPPLSLWRDSQTVQAYLGGEIPIAKLPSPGSWARKTAASYALLTTSVESAGSAVNIRKPNSNTTELEQIMELKRQLAHTSQDLHLTKIRRSLSTGNGAVMAMISPTSGDIPGAPGSPYRAASGSAINNCPPKPSLSKELMQKLRSMTETIKMLSDENALLRTQNEQILRTSKEDEVHSRRKSIGLYDDLEKQQLLDLVVNYDEKLKALSAEVLDLQKKLKIAEEASREVEAATQSSKTAAEKDKYKQLARRLKEERNNYRESLEAKKKEQADLKIEMEKMSDLISELRVNCQTLQLELSEVRSGSRDLVDVAVQASLIGETRPSTRKMSTSSITQESIRKARSVYGSKQPKLTRSNNNHENSTSSSMTSLKESENNRINSCKKLDRSTSMSPSKPPANCGPRIAKPVTRTAIKKNSAPPTFSPAKMPLTPASTISSVSSSPRMTSPRVIPSKIPQPETPSPRKSRIPSAPRYHTPPNRGPAVALQQSKQSPLKSPSMNKSLHNASPRRAVSQSPSASSTRSFSSKLSSPPPAPPPTQMRGDDKVEQTDSSPDPPTPTPSPHLPPPGPPASRVSNNKVDSESENEDEEDDEILRVTSDGLVEMTSSNQGRESSQLTESPIIPSVIEKSSANYHHSSSGSEENPSADDEGSRDGDDQSIKPMTSSSAASNSVECTPKTKKKVENFRQGLAARRIQRTWKHFYEELEERKDVRSELPEHLVQVIEEKAKLETVPSAASSPNGSPQSINLDVASSPKVDDSFDKGKAVEVIEEAFLDHQRRERSLAGLKAKIHTARPWQKKKKTSESEVAEESSEEELERAYRALHLKGNDIRAKVSVIKADQGLFQTGKVSEIAARLNQRRRMSKMSDGITEEDDDDDDVVY